MIDLKRRLARLLIEKSYLEGDFTLTSGKKSDYYFDCKHTALHPEGAWLIGKLFLDMIRAKGGVTGVGGMTLGADPLVSSVTVVSHLEGYPLPGFIIRKQSKGHGTNQYLEGLKNFEPGQSVCLLEDVITTGGTLLTAVERVRDQGLNIACIMGVLDREQGGRENLEKAGFDLQTIFTRKELLETAKN
ncbi:orotate phosphoribosyltransferase [Desulfomicrobium sp. ZS1]|uniref:orotate phosphoribosyltransferase n=1 Tax=Desulfomicrobium sp. ZS1 TaxID=2952228 RepID=UPI0020B34B4E|nr:orotate phosphoribosyltransferase [Desulfomicrobium sp. ZS1]UTF49934.1 orotate phosphoribosyltransferase [Desulfomicrobium sp. ZS1]